MSLKHAYFHDMPALVAPGMPILPSSTNTAATAATLTDRFFPPRSVSRYLSFCCCTIQVRALADSAMKEFGQVDIW